MSLLLAGMLLILAAGAAAVGFARHPRVADAAFRVLFAGGCVLGAVPAVAVLGGAAIPELRIAAAVPGGGWVFGIDPLSAAFLLAIFAATAASGLYGVTYLAPQRDRRAVHLAHLSVTVLVVALAAVVTARAAVPFLIAWEMMAVVAYVLVVFEHEQSRTRRAGLLYLVATHAGTLALFALFAIWGAGARDLSFAALAQRSAALPAGGAAVLVLALIGFGMKAGAVPFHFWLPEAHAAAPSHVSALMSGVVIKMGIYGLLRVETLLAPSFAWWGWLLLGLGSISGVLGVVWALAQHDLKRLLAYHSVENIGIILLGLGAGALGQAYQRPVVAVLGFAAAALHTLNHALFKSLLFLGAGSVAHATGTREIDRLGGIAKTMPLTAASLLIGSAAIVGLPPLNGFLSEWLVVLALLHAGLGAGGERLAVLAVAALALIGALALACFAKVIGVACLGLPRDPASEPMHESTTGMLAPMFALAAACIGIGLLPLFVLPAAFRVGAQVAGSATLPAALAGVERPVTLFALGLAATLSALWLLRAWWLARAPRVPAETWACGYELVTARMQYTASSFAAPLLTAYRAVAGVTTHRTAAGLHTYAADPVLRGVLEPSWRGVRAAAARLRPLQRGRLSLYLGYIAAALVLLLVYLLLAGGRA